MQDFSLLQSSSSLHKRCLDLIQRFRSGRPYPIPSWRMFLAAFSSRSNTQPHLQIWVLVDSIFFTTTPQLEHSWLVYCGLTATVTLLNTFAQYSIQTRNWYQYPSLIDLARQWFFTQNFILLISFLSSYSMNCCHSISVSLLHSLLSLNSLINICYLKY